MSNSQESNKLPVSMEETVDFMLNTIDIRKQLTSSDYRILSDIRIKTWRRNNAISTLQQGLVSRLISKYLALLELCNWPVEDLIHTRWKSNVVVSERISSKVIDVRESKICLQFPWDEKLIQFLKSAKINPIMLDTLGWNPDKRTWDLSMGAQSAAIVTQLLSFGGWRITDAAKKALAELQQATNTAIPIVDYQNGWTISDESLITPLTNSINPTDSLIQQAFDISDLAVNFTAKARMELEKDLSPDKMSWLLDHTFRVPYNDTDKITEIVKFINQINKWPMLIFFTPNAHCSKVCGIIETHILNHRFQTWKNQDNIDSGIWMVPDTRANEFLDKNSETHWPWVWILQGIIVDQFKIIKYNKKITMTW